MTEGATLIAPEAVWLSFDTRIGRDVVIEPNVVLGPGVTVADGVEIKANCHIEGAKIGAGARIGPFARLRPGADLGADVHVGNFVEVKNVAMGEGAKANHRPTWVTAPSALAPTLAPARFSATTTASSSTRTEVGAGAFVGSNSALVAPVKIGEGAYIGSGSVIIKDVAPGALALERSTQEERPGWAEKFRQMMLRKKAKTG